MDHDYSKHMEYDINNHILNTVGLFNVNIFSSKRKLITAIISNIFGKIGLNKLDNKVERSIDSFWRPTFDGAVECLWLGWYVSLPDFIKLF